MLDELPDFEAPEEWTRDPDGCCASSERQRIADGKGEYAFGTTGTVHYSNSPTGRVPAVVLADCGTACGGGDDIKCAWNPQEKEHRYNNEWLIDWFDAYDFEPDV